MNSLDGDDDSIKAETIARTIFGTAYSMIASYTVWAFSSKYFHTSVEIPLMYHSKLSHMEISKRW
jgi:hypothetical protein